MEKVLESYRDANGDLIEVKEDLLGKHWYKNGKKHRDNDLPAVECKDGSKHWYNDGFRSYLKLTCLPGCIPGRLT